MLAVVYERSAWFLLTSTSGRLACPPADALPVPDREGVLYLQGVADALLVPTPSYDFERRAEQVLDTPSHPVVALAAAARARRAGDPTHSASLPTGADGLPRWLLTLIQCERGEGLRLLGEYERARAVLDEETIGTWTDSQFDAFCLLFLWRRRALVLRSMGEYHTAATVDADIRTLARAFPALRDCAEFAKHLAAAAELTRSVGRPHEALPAARHAHGALAASLGVSHPDTLCQLGNIGETLRALGRIKASIQAYRECINGLLETLGPGHPEVGKRLLNLAHAYREAGRGVEARICALHGREVLIGAYGEGHHHVAKANAAVAGLGLAGGLRDAVAGLIGRSQRLPPTHHHVHRSLRQVAAALNNRGQTRAAEHIKRAAAELERARAEKAIHGPI